MDEYLLESLKNLRIVVIGDIMLDHYIWGDSYRISPEAPVPVVQVEKDTYVPGGASNVALNVKSLGGIPFLCGSVANDDAGEQLRIALNASGVYFDSRFARNEAPTILKTRVIVRNQQLCRLDRESSPSEYHLNDGEEYWQLLEAQIKNADAVIFSDYAKGVITEDVIECVQMIASKYNVLTAMDPKPRNKIHYKGIDLMTPNRVESLELAKMDVDHTQKFPVHEVADILWRRFQSKYILITLGAQGMILCEEGKVKKVLPALAQEVFDVSGAGDTVIAATTLGLAAGASFEDAATFANIAAGIVVSKLGTATATYEEVKERLSEFSSSKLGINI